MLNRRRLRVLTGMAFLLTVQGFGAGKLTRSEAVGSIARIKGTVLVDQQTPMLMETVFAGDVVSTGAGSGAILTLRSGAVATLVENTELRMTGVGDVTLAKGAVLIRNAKAQDARVSLAGASVIVRGDGTFPSICRIASVDRSAVVIADKGHVEIHGAGAPTLVPAGKTVHLENGVPQGGKQPRAGRVAGEIPAAEVTHQGTPSAVPLGLNNAVYWQDTVHTIKGGRARIGLDGGSVLLVGANSTMTIVQHNQDSQQTVIELAAGKLRSEVTTITKKDGKFETRTPTAVIGVVGTTVLLDAKPKVTKVWNSSPPGNHFADVSNLDKNVIGHVNLGPGQFTIVRFGLPPTPPVMAPGGQIAEQTNQTNVQEGPPAGGPPGGTQGGNHPAQVRTPEW